MKNCLPFPIFNWLRQFAPKISMIYIASQPISLNIYRNKKHMEQNLQRDECNARRFPTKTTHVFHKS